MLGVLLRYRRHGVRVVLGCEEECVAAVVHGCEWAFSCVCVRVAWTALDDDDTLSGCVWDCKHIFEVRPGADGNTVYKLQTNVSGGAASYMVVLCVCSHGHITSCMVQVLVSVNVASSSTGNMETRAHSQQTVCMKLLYYRRC